MVWVLRVVLVRAVVTIALCAGGALLVLPAAAAADAGPGPAVISPVAAAPASYTSLPALGVATALARAGSLSLSAETSPVVDPSAASAVLTAPTLASTSASFKVAWRAEPALPAGGYDAYRVEYREPGVEYWFVWQQATPATSAVFPGQPGHAYEFRAAVAKTTDSSVVGPWSTVDTTAAPADDAAMVVTKTWKRASLKGAYYGKIRTASAKSATATYRFTGTKAALIAPRGRALGKVAVYVRSATASGWTKYKLAKTIDLYSRKARARVVTTLGSWSASTGRQVKFLVTGKKNRRSSSTKVSLDGIAVYGARRTVFGHTLTMAPATPSVVIGEQLHFTATISDCVDQRVLWTAYRVGSDSVWHTDDAGTISADGLYAAPALPSNDAPGDDRRVYIVTATGVANPDILYAAKFVQVTLGPAPVVDDVQPRSASVGSSVTITGQHFTDHGGVPKVFFNGIEGQVTSASDTSLKATVPGGWQTWKTSLETRVWVETWSVQSSVPADLLFTVTGILPAPPAPWSNGINAGTLDDDNASPGDSVRILGNGFAPNASDNFVRFGGDVIAAATSYQKDAYSEDLGTISVTVPDGAQTGALAVKRLDGDGSWNAACPTLTVQPATVPTAALHPSFAGSITGPLMVRNGTWGNEEWLLTGTGFTKLRLPNYSTTANAFYLDVRRDGVIFSRVMRPVSDTLAVPHRTWGVQEMMPDSIFAETQPGDTVELRIRGAEMTNAYERSSGWVPVSLGDRPLYGAVHDLPVDDMPGYWGTGKVVARGDWLLVKASGLPATQLLSAPGLWTGTLPLGADGIARKLVRLGTVGTYTITNQTKGQSVTFAVKDVGGFGDWHYGGTGQYDLHVNGLLMRFAGGTIDVPPGALSPDDLGASTAFGLEVVHTPSSNVAFDPVLTDGGSMFTLSITPEPTRLLKPITVTLPYEPSGRTTQPFFGLWDAASSLYYDCGVPAAGIDTANHTVTLVLAAGTYSSTVASTKVSAARVAADSAPSSELLDAPVGSGVPSLKFNALLRDAALVSMCRATSGQDFVWHPDAHPTWGIRVDAVTDSSSASYVSPEKAQEVLAAAAQTWANLAAKGWPEPEAMITITVRDYGDPGVYQGATTKAVFGQPWVYVNSRLTMGAKLETAVSHEMGHLFQRQITTNISTKWIDEAVAEWVAWDTLGSRSDLQASFVAGCDFPTVTFPSGFWLGYTPEQAYGAGAFIIWLAKTGGADDVLRIYQTLENNPGYWGDSSATFLAATGRTIGALLSDFAPAFWLQAYDPIKPYPFWSGLLRDFSQFSGASVGLTISTDASRAASIAPKESFRAALTGQPMVVRAPGLPDGARIEVWEDSASAAAPPAAPVLVGMLSGSEPIVDLGTFPAALGCYRLVAVPSPGAGMTAGVTVEAVHVMGITPLSGMRTGGYPVTLSGSGFGDKKGIVMIGPATVSPDSVTAWTDTSIVFTMPGMGTTTGVQSVDVRPLVGGHSNAVSFEVL